MARASAGILLYRRRAAGLEVLLVHPGGPYWRRRDEGAWSIPKGETEPGEDSRETALRELSEETGLAVDGEMLELEPIRQRGGKVVHAWAAEGREGAARVGESTFSMPWPPGSTRMKEFPEVDRAEWFDLSMARRKVLASQEPLLDQLVEELGKARHPSRSARGRKGPKAG